MKSFLSLMLLVVTSFSFSQVTITGTVTDKRMVPIEGANVYLKGTYDGSSTIQDGTFSFTTSEVGTQTLVISYISFETFELVAEVNTITDVKIQLKEAINTLTGVTLSAGTFEAGDNSKVSVLKPLDVVTTASALGDFVGALQTLPGTSAVAEDGRLFVRGGGAEETQIFIDGVRVFTPFTPTSNNIPTRGRYSPFLFKGISFSTGGYSAEFGQALSGVLQLNTIDEPDQDKTDISLMTVGGGVGHTKKWKNNSVSVNASYINLAPYISITQSRDTWNKPYEGLAGEAVFRQKYENGILKLYAATDYSNFDLLQDNINFPEGFRFSLTNRNSYLNGSLKYFFDNDWTLQTGLSYTNDNTNILIDEAKVKGDENSIHVKAKVKKGFTSKVKLSFGTEYFITRFKEKFSDPNASFTTSFENDLWGSFAEADIFISNDFAFKPGIRAEYAQDQDKWYVSPRLSVAYKTGDSSQFSLAYGDFYQNPLNEYLKLTNTLEAEKATHYLLNYQYSKERRILRAELFHKEYDNLVKFDDDFPIATSNFNNNGDGYATGLDLFWRDGKSIKNFEYWLSYSYLDTERDYRNYPQRAIPNFSSEHNISLVGKWWVEKLRSQVGFSHTFATGRTYTDRNTDEFLAAKTKNFNSLSINWAYLISQQKILYFSINNVLGTRNVFGYDYANTPNMNGVFERQARRPNADQFFFVGFFWTISTDKSSNQLDNL
ncbi:TonB-dependent receptor [Spongiivirga citrea]|uniref:TonB-dependent receptor plug domain-containing protein n=1 Tax=Spongiivirga citrea TaxID=1481457 RepID=A0A6M0CJE0_9FLAO|nr:TonB-dependent receptor [Spongiivirga citrea]NER17712.1 TonB-dependent receptor plug domain-containing protein [Spongiivirga citrea]